MVSKRYYQLLGLEEGASLSAIKSAYRKMAFKYHPDRNLGDPTAEDKFKDIVEAYEELNKLARDEAPSPPHAYKKRRPVRKKASRPKTPPRPHQAKPSAPTPETKKRNLRYNVFVSLEESLKGCTKIIRFIRQNNGQKENVQLKIQVPVGARHLQRLKISGFGEVSESGKGDLFVIVHLQPHHQFDVEDMDISTRVPVTYLQALLGSEILIPTLEGVEKISLNPCEFSNIYHELPQKGLIHREGGQRGSLFVECYIDRPEKLTETEKNTLEALSKSWPTSEKMKEYRDDLIRGESQ